MSVTSLSAAAFAVLAELFAPTTCAACDARVRPSVVFCAACAVSLERAAGPSRSGALAPFVYGGAASLALTRLKYHDRPDLAPRLGRALGLWLAPRLEARGSFDVVVPVPMHAARLAARGFDHAALLSSAVARALQLAHAPRTLLRRRDTARQVSLARDARLRNLEHAVTCRLPERVRGRRVLLVDDVVTTGATLSVCALALRGAGAAHVGAATFAIRDDEVRPHPLSSPAGR